MKIAVCDFDAADRKRLCTMITLYCERHALQAEVEGFSGGAELLKQMKKAPFAIVFLHIPAANEDGIELARVIRKRANSCALFFSADSGDFALAAFELGALHYLIKPFSYAQLEKALERCGELLLAPARTLVLSPKQQTKVLINDILYVEALDRLCHIHLADSVETTRKKIKDLEAELGSTSFLRCHRSYIVNLQYVREYSETDFVLHNGMRVPIRQEGRSRIKRVFHNYLTMHVTE